MSHAPDAGVSLGGGGQHGHRGHQIGTGAHVHIHAAQCRGARRHPPHALHAGFDFHVGPHAPHNIQQSAIALQRVRPQSGHGHRPFAQDARRQQVGSTRPVAFHRITARSPGRRPHPEAHASGARRFDGMPVHGPPRGVGPGFGGAFAHIETDAEITHGLQRQPHVRPGHHLPSRNFDGQRSPCLRRGQQQTGKILAGFVQTDAHRAAVQP